MSGKMHRLQFYLEPDVNASLDHLAKSLQMSKAELIRRSIRRFLEEEGVIRDPAWGIVGLFGDSGPAGNNWAAEHDTYIYRRDWED